MESEIVSKIDETRRAAEPDLFVKVSQVNATLVCKRNFTNILRYSAAALLFDERDHIPDNFLLWYKTIVRTFKYERVAGVTYRVVQDVTKEYLTSQ